MVYIGRYIVFFLFFSACVNLLPGKAQDRSTFNFTKTNFSTDYAWVSGPWEFHYDTLLTPDQLKNTIPTSFLRVPGSWHWNSEYPLRGKATYKCQAVLPHDQTGLLLYISIINSSSKIWINGELRSSSGQLSDNEYQAELTNNYIPIPDHEDTLEIVIQVANYTYFNSGLVSTPVLGQSSRLIKEKTLRNGIENVFAGSLIAMFIYQFLLFFLYNRGKPNLWLALICLAVAIRSMTLNGGSFLLPNLFPDIPYELWKKIEFGGVYMIVALFPLYVHHLFQSSSSKVVVNFFCVLSTALFIPVIFLPQYQYGQLLDVCHIALVLSFIYAIVTIVRAWIIRKNPDSKYIFFGVIASFPFILLEILKNTALVNFDIRFGYLVELGLLVFLVFQVYILARHYANSYKSLEEINQELELEVKNQTKALVNSNLIKERLLSIISHDVKSPLNNLKGLLSLHDSNALSQADFGKFVKKIDENLGETTSMVENILFWTARQRKGEGIKLEAFDVSSIIDENIKQIKNTSQAKSLNITCDVDSTHSITSDKGIINFAIRNLLANAVKFSHEGGLINIGFIDKNNHCEIIISDAGVGMSEDQVSRLFAPEQVQSTEGTHAEVGTGIGLNLAKEYLEELGGSLKVTSQLKKGSTFTISIPNA